MQLLTSSLGSRNPEIATSTDKLRCLSCPDVGSSTSQRARNDSCRIYKSCWGIRHPVAPFVTQVFCREGEVPVTQRNSAGRSEKPPGASSASVGKVHPLQPKAQTGMMCLPLQEAFPHPNDQRLANTWISREKLSQEPEKRAQACAYYCGETNCWGPSNEDE